MNCCGAQRVDHWGCRDGWCGWQYHIQESLLYLILFIIVVGSIFRPWEYEAQVNFAEKFKDKTYDIIPQKELFDPFDKEYTQGGRIGRMSYVFKKDGSYIDFQGVENQN